MQPIATSSPYAMISVSEALDEILGRATAVGDELIGTLTARGRVLAATVTAGGPMPPVPRAAVDGYAVLASDRGARELVGDELVAGPGAVLALARGQAVRIMTGADLPDGADAVVMVEDSREQGSRVTFRSPIRVGDNVHAVGVDVRAGDELVAAGEVLGPAELGILAAVGQTEVRVHRRVRVAVLATGDELVEPWLDPPRGCIRDSNRYALRAAVEDTGALVTWHGMAPDDESGLRGAVERALAECDVLITSGGVSMGTRDLMKPLLESLGSVHFGRVNFKPGKPLTFATIGERLVFALPGYPVSSLVTYEVFVRPALMKLQGMAVWHRPVVSVTLGHDVKPDHSRPEYQRATISVASGALVAKTTGSQGSSRLLSMRGANALLRLEPGVATLPAGSSVAALLTGPVC